MRLDAAELVYEYVRSIPSGKVVTYGQVKEMIDGVRLTAIQVGRFMANAPNDVPWQRVVGVRGTLPIGKRAPEFAQRQRRLLEQEGVEFMENGRIDMEQYGLLQSENTM